MANIRISVNERAKQIRVRRNVSYYIIHLHKFATCRCMNTHCGNVGWNTILEHFTIHTILNYIRIDDNIIDFKKCFFLSSWSRHNDSFIYIYWNYQKGFLFLMHIAYCTHFTVCLFYSTELWNETYERTLIERFIRYAAPFNIEFYSKFRILFYYRILWEKKSVSNCY